MNSEGLTSVTAPNEPLGNQGVSVTQRDTAPGGCWPLELDHPKGRT